MSHAHSNAMASLPAVRRRRVSTALREKTSLSIRADVLAAAREIVQSGQAENLSALVENALEEKVMRIKRAALYLSYATASQDSAFMHDMDSVSKSFDTTVEDGL
jgi:hypothetical protein